MVTSLRYAALGSSFAAGPGIAPIVDVDAMRSGRNYPHLLAELLGADLIDATVSGATTATILDEPQLTMTGVEFPPQVGLLSDAVDLVTVTAGGNDLKYAASMLFTAWGRVAPDGPIARMLAADLPAGVPAPTSASVERAAAGLAEIVERVRIIAPRARVLLVDYLSVFGDRTVPGPGVPFEPGEIAALRDIQSALEAAYVAAAERSGAELVAISNVSRDHAVGSAEPWVAPFIEDPMAFGGSFHPNAAGMAAVAAHLEKVVGR